jgi:hypothetical protein
MANSYTGLFQSLAASFNRASLAKEGRNVLLTMVTRDFEPSPASRFSVINTNIIAGTGSTTNLTSGTLTLSDVTIDPGAVVLNQFPAYGFALPNYDFSRAASGGLVDKLRDEAIKKIGNSINGTLAALVTTANFTSHQVAGSGADTITDAKMAEAWGKLAGSDVAVGDMGNFFLVAHPAVYANLLQTNSWTQSAFVGDPKSGEIRSSARLGLQWGALADFDPDMPVADGVYDSLLFHRHAIVLVARAPAMPINNATPYAFTTYKGIPILMTVDWDQLTQRNTIVFTALYGVKVARQDHGCILTSD